jgi:hypothetical protein
MAYITYNIKLMHNIFNVHSAAQSFYLLMLRKGTRCPHLLNVRAVSVCRKYNFNSLQSFMCDKYINGIKPKVLATVPCNTNGLVDTLRSRLHARYKNNTLSLIRLLLGAFWSHNLQYYLICITVRYCDVFILCMYVRLYISPILEVF